MNIGHVLTQWFEGTSWRAIVDVGTLLLALAAITLAWRDWRETRFTRRVQDFALMHTMQANDSPRIRNSLTAQRLHQADIAAGLQSQDLVIHPTWCWHTGQPLVRLSRVSLIAHSAARDQIGRQVRRATRAMGLLPRADISLADNLLLYTADRSYDGPAYGLRAMPIVDFETGEVELTVGLGSYFEFINTCACFGYEAAHALVHPRSGYPLRGSFPYSDFNNRHVQIGIVSMVVIRNVRRGPDRRAWFLVHHRSSAVTESANLVNAVPGATFQPAQLDAATALDSKVLNDGLLETVVREFCEEVRGLDEFTNLTSGETIRGRAEWPILMEQTYFLGMGLNPLNPYVELLCLTALDVGTDEHRELLGGDTYEQVSEFINANAEGTIELKPFDVETLSHLRHHYRAAPALRQLCRIALDGLSDQAFTSLTVS